jgi:uncharacterized protein YidB (DUF937 family)
MATGAGGAGGAAGGLVQELQNQPGGVAGLVSTFQQNGMGGLVQQWAGGQTGPAQPDQIQQGLAGTGIIEKIAERTGMSPEMIKIGLAVAVPFIIHHLFANNHVTPDGQPTENQPEAGGLLQSILSHIG